jgi:DNA polymerase V
LQYPYNFEKAKLIVKEMADLLVLDLVDKGLVTDQIVLTVGYDIENLTNPEISKAYKGEITTDYYGRKVPKHAHGTANIGHYTSSTKLVIDAVTELYKRIVNPALLVRRINITAARVLPEGQVDKGGNIPEQLDMFTDYEALEEERKEQKKQFDREKKMQKTVIGIKKKYGKNAIVKGMNLEEGATAKERNRQIGGHKA